MLENMNDLGYLYKSILNKVEYTHLTKRERQNVLSFEKSL